MDTVANTVTKIGIMRDKDEYLTEVSQNFRYNILRREILYIVSLSPSFSMFITIITIIYC
jgi:hypothetical protein